MGEKQREANTSTEGAPKKRGWRRVWRWTWKSLLWMLVFVVSLPFLVLLSWQIGPVRRGLKDIGLSVASNFLYGKLEVRDLGGNLWSSIEVKDARWYRCAGPIKKNCPKGPLMAGLAHLRVRYDLWHFLQKGELLVTEVYLKKPEGYLGLDAKYNLDLVDHIATSKSPVKKPPPPKPSGGEVNFNLRVLKVVIEGLQATFKTGPKALPIGLKNFHFEANYQLQLKGLRMSAQVKHLSFQASNPDVEIKRLKLFYWMKGDRLGADGVHILIGKHSEIKLDSALHLVSPLGLTANIKRLFVHPDDVKPVVPALPVQTPVEGTVKVTGTLASLTANLQLKAGQAGIHLLAKDTNLTTPKTYDVDLSIQHANLKEILGQPALDSDLSLRLLAKGQGYSGKTEGKVSLELSPGRFQNYKFSRIKLEALAKDGSAKIKQFRIHTPLGRLSGRADVNYLSGKYDAFLSGYFPNLRPIGDLVNQQLRGTLRLNAWIKGDQWKPNGRASVSLSRFQYLNARKPVAKVKTLSVSARLRSLSPLTALVTIRGRDIRAGGQRVRRLQMDTWAQIDPAKQTQKVRFSRFSFDIGTGLFRLERNAFVQVNRAEEVNIRRLWWRNRAERIRVDGWFNWKRWRQRVHLQVKSLRLAALRKALKILPQSRLDGLASVDVKAHGSFAWPRLSARVELKNAGFRQFQHVNATLSMGYQWKRQQTRKLVLDVNVKQRNARGKYDPLLTLGLHAPVRLDLRRVALRGDLRRLLLLRQPFQVRLDVPGLDLGWLGKKLKLPQLKGFIATRLRLENTLRQPRMDLALRLRKAGWDRFKSFDAEMFVTYRRGSLRFSRKHPKTNRQEDTVFQLNGRKMLVLAGQLPLLVEVLERRGVLTPKVQLLDQNMAFSMYIERQRLDWLLRQLAPSVSPNIAYLDGLLDGFLVLRGRPSAPHVDLSVQLLQGSFCPLTEDGFTCEEDVGFDKEGKFEFQKVDDITQTLRRPSNLRIKGLRFALDLHYIPPTASARSGRLTFNTRLAVHNTVLLAIGKYAKPKRQCRLGNGPLTSGPQPVELAMKLSVNPQTLKPTFELLDPIRLTMQIPKIKFETIAKWVRLPVLSKLKGAMSLDFSVCNRLSNPDLKVVARLEQAAYEASEDADGKPVYLDKLGYELDLNLQEGNLGWFMQAWVLGKRLFDSTAVVRDMRIGLNPKTFQLVGKSLGSYVSANLRIPGFDLSELATRIGMHDQLYGVVSGNIEIDGDPACPLLGRPTKGERIRNHLTINNGYVGIRRALFRQLRKQKTPASKIAALYFKRLQLVLRSIADGRVEVNLGVWKNRNPVQRMPDGSEKHSRPDVLAGNLRWPLPLFLVPYAAKTLVASKRCRHWPGGKPSSQIKVSLVQNDDLPLRFIEAFVPGLKFDAKLSMGITAEGTTQAIKNIHGSVMLSIRQIAMQEYGLNILSNLADRSLAKQNSVLWQHCQSIRHTKNRNAKTKVFDHHIDGCSYSYLMVSLEPKAYRLEGRLQGSRGRPLVMYGDIPRRRFGLDITPPQECIYQKSKVYFSVRCTKARTLYNSKKIALFVRSQDFQPMATPQHKVSLNVALDVLKTWNTPLRLLGQIRIPDMLFTLPETSRKPGSYNDHQDMVLLGDTRSEKRLRPSKKKQMKRAVRRRRRRNRSQNSGVMADLKIVIPRGIRIRNRELDLTARTEEFRDLHVTLAGDMLRLVGGVEVVRGDITLYTKKFSVQSGSRVTFMGQSLSLDELSQLNARLAITAVYSLTVPKTSSLAKGGHSRLNILLIVKGTILKPELDFQVEYAATNQRIPMDRANVLTLILTGTTTEDLAGGGQQRGLSDQALGVFSKLASAQLRNQLSRVVPIDVLKIETGARAEDIKIEIGKYFFKWMYGQVLYKPVPLEEEDLWEVLLDIAISRQLSLEVRFGQRKRNNSFLFRNSTHLFYRIKR